MTYEDAITALADGRRRTIFESLRDGPRTVREIAQTQPVSRPAVSQHLKVLEMAGLVQVRPQGTRRYYSIRREGLAELRRWVEGFWDDVLESFAAEIEQKRECVMVEPINKSIDVAADPDTAFAIFTERMADWWPLDKNSISAMSGEVAKSLELEPRVGGQVIETKADGERAVWARVKAFEPGSRLVLAWHIMTPEDLATEVEIRFTANGDGTRVDLTHRGWEIMGEDGETNRGHYDNGWVGVFEECYARACAA